MNIRILTVGKLKEKYWRDAMAEYEKRIKPYGKLMILEGPEENAGENMSAAQKKAALAKEGRFFRGKMKEGDYNIALALEGELISSEALAELMADTAMMKGKTINFLIGGSFGLDEEIKNDCQRRISFGRATFPHQMMRVFLTEQIYRGIKIIRGEPYHK